VQAADVQPSVLLVEDDAEIRELESFILASEGYHVWEVDNGLNAFPAALEHCPDVLLLDLMLPGRSGSEVLAELASHPVTALLPVVIVSAYPETLHRTAQVLSLIVKPFDVGELIDAVAIARTARRGVLAQTGPPPEGPR